MTQVRDKELISINCHISGETLAFSWQDKQLDSALEIVFDELATSTLVLTDFEHNDERLRVHAFIIGDNGDLTPWERTTEGVILPVSASNNTEKLHFTVTAVAYEPTGEVNWDDIDTYEPTTWQTTVRVDVPPKGSKPL